jgi:hypothetical protein
MNRFENITKPLRWLMALLLVAVVAGCGGGNGVPSSGAGSSPTGGVCTGGSCVNIGTAANYAILAKAGASTAGSTTVTGNVGVSPIKKTGLTGWSETYDVTDTYATSAQVVAPYKLYAADNTPPTPSDLGTAVLNMGTAYTNAGLMATTGSPACPGSSGAMNDTNDVGALAAGVYTCAIDVSIPSGILTLNGSATDVWVFNITGKLTQISGTQVKLTGGALPQNVFWVVSGVVDIGTTAHMEGVILAQTNIAVGTSATVKGRLLAQTAVTLGAASTVTQP